MTFERFQHAPPRSWEEFEDLCLSLYSAIWNDRNAQKNGRRGDKQHGVDVWGRLEDGRSVAVQCKGKDRAYGGKITATELRKEVRKALTFEPPLSSWIIVTSGPKSAGVEAEARRISEEHRHLGLFEVRAMGWEDLLHLIADYDAVIEKHFAEAAPIFRRMAREVADIRASLLDPASATRTPQPSDLLQPGKHLPGKPPVLDAVEAERLRAVLGAASSTLLNWPTTTLGHWFSRPELETLLKHVTAGKPVPLVVLGQPGACKSALLARLGNELATQPTILLALKADAVPRHVTTAAQLDDFLGVPEPLGLCLQRLAMKQPVVLLIDQLDALADLMDQHGGRLNALLQLVAQVRGYPNLAVVLSCREFEFRHDARLTTLEAEPLHVGAVAWEEVGPVLQQRGLSPELWHPEFREVLRIPQHLDIFLQHLAARGEATPYSNYHEMLEEVFRRRVLAGGQGSENALALYSVARTMANDEDLWAASARFDLQAASISRMEAAGFLRRDGSRIGFRHQTLFDFVRARAFVADGESISTYALARQGTMFSRPTIWSALSYLRSAAQPLYEREMQRIWGRADVRPHLRNLLRDFMGQQHEPTDDEGRRMLSLLSTPSGARALRSMLGSPGWFRRLLPRLPTLMMDSNQLGWAAAVLLRFIVNGETQTVIELVQRHWTAGEHHGRVSFVLEGLKDWTDQAVALARSVAVHMENTSLVHLVGMMKGASRSDVAKVVAARLEAMLAQAQAGEKPDQVMERFMTDPGGMYGMPEIMARDPGAFVRELWPWMARVAALLASPPYRAVAYQADGGRMLMRYGTSDAGSEHRLAIAYAGAVAAWAGAEPQAFLAFAGEASRSDLVALHNMLVEGFVAVAPHDPQAVLDYLRGDPRRFHLGDHWDGDQGSRRLITAAATHLGQVGVEELVSAIRMLPSRDNRRDADPATRFRLRQWHRTEQLRLLLAIPQDVRPRELARWLEMELRAIGTPPAARGIEEVNGSDSPMSAAAMCKARDKDILRFLSLHPDSSEWGSISRPRRGRSVDAARAFGGFAKQEPRRALHLMDRLQAGEHERPVAEALSVFSQDGLLPPQEMIDLVMKLHERGFASNEFRQQAGYALCRAAKSPRGLDDAVCGVVRSWLTPWQPPEEASYTYPKKDEDHPHPILWDSLGMRFLPGGNYPLLRALELGLLLQQPADADAWLVLLEEHASRPESPAVWQALADELRFLVHADRVRAVAFLDGLLATESDLVNSPDGVRLLAWTHDWLPEAVLQRTVHHWMGGGWKRGMQAAGEMVTLRWLMVPNDGWAASLVNGAMQASEDSHLGAFRLGMAYTASATWNDLRFRGQATSLFERLAPSNDEEVASALGRVFSRAQGHPWDAETERVLRAAVTSPSLLAVDAHFLPLLLKEVLRDGIDPTLVGAAGLGIVRGTADQIGSRRMRWAGSAGELFEIATTLQRTSAVQEGVELFEELLDTDAHMIETEIARFDRNRFA